MNNALAYLTVALGSALGGVGRFWISGWVARRFGDQFPWGTLTVNLVGSLVIGVLAAAIEPTTQLSPRARAFTAQFLMAGLCGGFTTFSAFSVQTLRLLQSGAWSHALGNIFGSVLLCLAGVWLGFLLGQSVHR